MGHLHICYMMEGANLYRKVFNAVSVTPGIDRPFIRAYRSQTNGQVERFKRTFLAALCAFCTDSGKDFNTIITAITYVYNNNFQRSRDHLPFELILTPPPPPLVLQRAEYFDHSDITA